MASLGESSLGSVPIDIAALHDHLLQNGQPSADAQTPRPRPDTLEHDRSHTSQSLSQPTGEAPSHVAAITASGSTLQVPQLTPSKSAPADLDAMVRRTPSQDAMLARAVTFNAYAGGDTQPMESQVYRDFTESMTRSSGTTPKKTILHYDANAMHDENTYGTTSVNGRTQHTMDQGDDGFVDLEGAWQPEDSPGAKSATSGIEELLAGPETQSQNNIGANGSFAPRTPGLAGHQRTRSGDIPTSATDASRKTPAGFSQMFGMTSKLPMLSATQLFDQTQALSSPTADAIRSDPVVDRPSPILNTHSDFSPNVVSSSPMLMMRNPPASTAGEPRDTYTSMRESQERRAARLRQDLELQNRFGPDAIAERLEDDEDDTQQRRLDRQRLHRVLSDQATDEWSKYRAPSRPGHRSVSAHKRTTTIDLVTPGTVRKHGRVQFDLLDDEQETDNDDDMEVDLPAEVEDAHDGEGVHDVEVEEDNHDDNDIYDEYSQQVLRSQRDPEDEDDEDDRDVHDDQGDENEVDDEDGSEHGSSAERDDTGNDVDAGGADELLDEAAAGTQPAVADSQPERLEAQRSLLMEQPPAQHVTSSIIPGSQYAGLTSQELVRHSNRVPNSSTLSQQFAQEVSKSQTRDSRVPSSPPVPIESSGEREDRQDATDSPTRQRPLAESDTGRDLLKGAKIDRREIPESDQPDRLYREDQESAQEENIFETAGESNTVAPYSTAQTHLDESAHTPEKPKLVKELSKVEPSQQSVPTPLRAAGVRRFADITADPSPPEFSTESQLDMDAIMGNVISMDDQNFMDVLSSPPSEKPTKRRRLLPQDASKRRSRLPSMELAGSETAVENLFGSSSPVKAANLEPTELAPVTEAPAVVEAIQSSPKKANDPPSATPEEAQAPDTPESVRRREQAGSKAASQLLSARPAFATKITKASHTKGDRKSSLSRAVERKPVSRRVSSKLKKVVEKATDEASSEDTALPNEPAVDQTTEAVEPQAAVAEAAVPAQALAIEVPARVLARFTGVSYNAYYPATWLSTVADGRSHVVRFDDSTVTTVDKKDVRSLDFRIDDAVRIDYEGFRSKTWLIKSFGRKARDEQDRANGVDIYGHVTLYVQAKVTGRNSMPAASAAPQGEGGIEEVMVTNVKITHNMITHFADRDFHPPDSNANATVHSRTPSAKGQSFDAETPSRSTRRAAASTAKPSLTEPSKLREESVASMSEVADAGMFEGMAFAISYASNEAEKFDVTRLIRRNGGLILEQGFDELFVQPQLDEQTTPTKRSAKTGSTAQSSIESGSLKLKPEYEKLGFIALIADKHSRRAKYMQALALDLPTLSGRWIIDSFDSSRNVAFPSSPRPWTRYLLPAGESSYLGGAIRSRTLQFYNPASAKLPSTVASRALLLEGAGVLLVAPKKGKGTWERRKAYAFLTLALGAGSVRRVADLAEAKKLLASDIEKQKWSWVYVDDDAGEAAKVLFGGKGSTGAGRKRKRNDGPQMCVEGMQGRVRVVGDEFVVQSLILGALVD